MLAEYSFSRARSNLTELIDRVQRLAPTVIRPRKKSEEASIVMPRSLLLTLLRETRGESAVIPRFVAEPDASITVILEPLDIAVNADTKEAAYSTTY